MPARSRAVEPFRQTSAGGAPVLFRGAVELLEVGADCLPLLDEARQDGVPGPGFNRHTGTEQAASDSSRLGVEQAWIDLHALREERTEAERRVGALIGRLRP